MAPDTVTTSGRAAPGAGFTAHVVKEVKKLSEIERSARVLERIRHAVLDWLGVTIAGAQEESAQMVQRVLRAEGGNPVARVIGTPHRLSARQAALAVGIAGHNMDYDDMGFGGHPSVVVLPAVFAVAEEVEADGPTTIEAILYGYQAMDLVSSACTNSSYVRGFHSTGTMGAFGAAVGAGRLLELNPLHLERALGIAGTQASGLKSSFGTMSKHLNAGHAAAVGVLSARLAEAGFTGPTDVLESPTGFAVTHNNAASDFDPTRPGTSLDENRLSVEKIMFKFHAACGATHSAIEGIRLLKAERAFAAEDVQDVELTVSDQLPQVCGIPEPQSGLEGMFSIRYAVALALSDSTTGPSAFTDLAVQDPRLIDLRQIVRVTPVSRIQGLSVPTEVKVTLKDGATLEAAVDVLTPAPDDQLERQRESLESKFRDLVEPILGGEGTDRVIATVQRLDSLTSIRELVDSTSKD